MAIWKLALAASVLSLATNAEAASVVYEFTGSGNGFVGGKPVDDFTISLAIGDDQYRIVEPTFEIVNTATYDSPFGAVGFTVSGDRAGVVSTISNLGIYLSINSLFDNPTARLPGPNQIFTLQPGSTVSYDGGNIANGFTGDLFQLRTYVIAQTVTGVVSFPSAIPEPSTWALMLAGFGMVGYALRRRKVAFA